MISIKKQKTHKKIITTEEIVSLYENIYGKKYCYLNQVKRPFEEMLLADNKSQRDYLIIHQRLRRIKSLESLASNQENSIKLLKMIVIILFYKQYEPGELVYKCGESQETVFVLFKGSADILKTIRIKVRMTEDEYILYLAKLFYYQEKDLLEKTILINEDLYGVTLGNFNHILKVSLAGMKELEGLFTNHNDYKIDPVTMQLDPSHIDCRKDFNAFYLFCLESACQSSIRIDKPKSITIKDYMKRIEIEYMPYSCNEERINYESYGKKECFIYQYEHQGIINQGQHFGEAFTNSDPHSTTIIIKEDSIIGIIDHSYIISSLKDYINPPGSVCCQVLLKNHIFCSANLKVFIQIYLNNFTFHRENQSQLMILSEGKTASKIYFTNQGEFEIYSRKSIKQLTEMIDYYRNATNSYTNYQTDDLIYTCMDSQHYKMKHPMILSIITGSDVLGFYDYTMNDKYTFSVKMKSNTAEYFSIDTQALTDMCMNNPCMYTHMNEYMNTKRKILLDKLIVFREKFYQQYIMLCEETKKSRIDNRILTINNKEYLPQVYSRNIKQQPLKSIRIKKHIDIHHSKSPPLSIIRKQPSKKTTILQSNTKEDEINEQNLFTERLNMNMKKRIAIIKPTENTSNNSSMRFNTITANNASHKNIHKNKLFNSTQSFSYLLNHEYNKQTNLHIKPVKTSIRLIQKEPLKTNSKIKTLKDFWNTFKSD